MLHFSGKPFRVPDHVWAHGFVTVDGQKMSKSRGTGLDPLVYLELGMDPEWLRYYFAYKLNSKVEDVDFSSADFISRTNSDLVASTSTLPAVPQASSSSVSRAASRIRPLQKAV